MHFLCAFFFFQAEDGIRDLTVTGVQTCALPISDGVREDADLRQPRRPLRRGDLPHRRATRQLPAGLHPPGPHRRGGHTRRSEEHTSELQSQSNLVCRLLLGKKKILPVFTPCATLLSSPT